MNTEPKKNSFSKYIIIMLGILIVIVLVLIAVILYSQMQPAAREDDAGQLAVTDAPTLTPVPTIEPAAVVTVAITDEVTATPEITPTPTIEGDVVWVNLSYLNIRQYPDFAYDRIISIPYGEMVTGTIDGLWMLTTYDGVTGYIYVGEVKDSDQPCVVYDPADLWPED